MNDQVKIRDAVRGDVPELLRLTRQLDAHHKAETVLTEDALHRHVFGPEPRCIVLVAEDEAKLAGFVAGFPTFSFHLGEPSFELQNLHVDTAARNRGVGRKLVEAFCALAAADGAVRVKLAVAGWNEGSRAFYKAAGFEERATDDFIRCVRVLDNRDRKGGPP